MRCHMPGIQKKTFSSRHIFHVHRKRCMRRAHLGAQTDVYALGASPSLSFVYLIVRMLKKLYYLSLYEEEPFKVRG